MAKSEWSEKKSGQYNPLVNVKEKAGKITEGIYKGSKEVLRDGDTSIVHTIDIKGLQFDFWGTGKLNMLLKGVEVDTEVRIEYLGLVEAKVEVNGRKMKKEVHDFKLYTR